MRRKIHLDVALLSTAITILVVIFMLMVYYRFQINNEVSSLKNTANLISNILSSSDMDKIGEIKNYKDTNLRMTLLNMDGDIVFDNMADIKNIENHMDRPEFKDAVENGYGESVRYSTTLGQDTYYYALKLQNNLVLRVSRQVDNVFSMFSRIMPIVFLIVITISIITFYTSSLLANHILKPIDIITKTLDGNLDEKAFNNLGVYDEISPFIRTFENQNKLIKERNKDLEEKANLLDIIISNMREGIILLDEEKKIISINKSGIRLLNGINNTPYVGEDFIRLCRHINLNQYLDMSIKERSNKDLAINHNHKYLDIYINPVPRERGLVGLLLLIVDSTEKHKLDLMRREFSANVSHELKTPLTSINGYAEMIKDGMAQADDIVRFASIIKKEGNRLLNLIDDIIKLSKIEDESIEKLLEPTDIYLVGIEAINSLKKLAQDKDINLEIKGNSSYIMGNKGMLQDLLYNLLENSIKYTNPGGLVTLSITNTKTHTLIKVTDTGIGISLENQERIFERFYIVEKSRSKKSESTGLGLSIVKHIVEYHNGRIKLESEVGKGTEITLVFNSL